jgi:hypothetical protein
MFRRELVARILASLGIAQAACGEGTSTETGTSTGTATTTASTTTTTSTTTVTMTVTDTVYDGGPGATLSCFPLQGDSGVCPTDLATALAIFTSQGCTTNWDVVEVLSGPVTVEAGECCYESEIVLCTGPTGRAYLVDHRPRVAAPRRGPDTGTWAGGARPDLDGLTARDRAKLAQAWAGDALQEHASVASFSRASLALLAAGAPAELIESTHRAALDEVLHARLCFTLASAYAGEVITPSPFPLEGKVQVSASLADIAESTVLEGCVGETISAVIAAEQLAHAVDPAVRAALARIAADEARHAELAWRTAAWAVRAGGTPARAAFEQALAGYDGWGPRAPPNPPDQGGGSSPPTASPMTAHGRLDAATAARVTALAIAEIVGPAARQLLREGA